MNEAKLTWQERSSTSEFVASVWICNAPEATTRTVLADPCTAIALVREGGNVRIVLRGPATKPHSELLPLGYMRMAIRLEPGVLLKGFSAQKFINSSLLLPSDVTSRFWFGGVHWQFPGFDDAELLIDQLYKLGYLSYQAPNKNAAAAVLSPRSYARLVKRTTGLSPYRLHQLQRMHQALRLLKQGVPAAMVAMDLDFVDQSHLTHASKQFLGHTPKQLLRLPQIP